MFNISNLDHVAIRVKDLNESAGWYAKVLGLKKVQLKEWGEYPIFMLAGTTGVALFPANGDERETVENYIFIDHFAFYVDSENFEKAKQHLKNLKIEYEIQDHYYFESIYFNDPNGHQVELTTKIKELEINN